MLFNLTLEIETKLKIRLEFVNFTGPFGYLVSRVLHKKEIYKTHIGLDANMANLMRPGMYGAYHHITVAGKEDWPHNQIYDVAGSLCEPIDRFAKDWSLPEIEIGDLVVIHDTGAHGHAMGLSELLRREDGQVTEIRRAETVEDYFATLDFNRLDGFEVYQPPNTKLSNGETGIGFAALT